MKEFVPNCKIMKLSQNKGISMGNVNLKYWKKLRSPKGSFPASKYGGQNRPKVQFLSSFAKFSHSLRFSVHNFFKFHIENMFLSNETKILVILLKKHIFMGV